MVQLIFCNVERDVKERLQRRARRHGRSMPEEVRQILRNVVEEEEEDEVLAPGLGTEISSLFAKTGIDFEIPELRSAPIVDPWKP